MTKTHVAAGVIAADPRWKAVLARDTRADGEFFYSVTTTGVYCRPSCGARLPRPEHVRFYPSPAEAERAGFRACKRCRPDQPSTVEQWATEVAELCRYIESAEHTPNLNELAARSSFSRFHLHRIFKAVTGLTPNAYAAAHRATRLRRALKRSGTVTEAIYSAGYGSAGRFYEESHEVLGMTPGAYRMGGASKQIRFAVGECSLGSILVAATDRGVCAILLGDERDALIDDLRARFPRATLIAGDSEFNALLRATVCLVEAPGIGLDLPLDLRGTAFQHRVWQALRQLPAGKTVTYSELAKRIGCERSARAVAQACAANPLAVAIPCHRVVRADGGLSGYRWGVERKRALLECERETYDESTVHNRRSR